MSAPAVARARARWGVRAKILPRPAVPIAVRLDGRCPACERRESDCACAVCGASCSEPCIPSTHAEADAVRGVAFLGEP